MSHCPGVKLEDFLVDWFRISSVKHGTSIRQLYANQIILLEHDFNKLVELYEPLRNQIEDKLMDYNEEDHGSWRDYRNYCFDFIPEEIDQKAEDFLKASGQGYTKGLFG